MDGKNAMAIRIVSAPGLSRMSILVQDSFARLISTTIAQQVGDIQAKALAVNEAERIHPEALDWGGGASPHEAMP